jgi:enoyl-CoA hydratase/carnithine racemase
MSDGVPASMSPQPERSTEEVLAGFVERVPGAGVAIALACDWRVLARDAYVYVPEVKIGLNLQWGALLVL